MSGNGKECRITPLGFSQSVEAFPGLRQYSHGSYWLYPGLTWGHPFGVFALMFSLLLVVEKILTPVP